MYHIHKVVLKPFVGQGYIFIILMGGWSEMLSSPGAHKRHDYNPVSHAAGSIDLRD